MQIQHLALPCAVLLLIPTPRTVFSVHHLQRCFNIYIHNIQVGWYFTIIVNYTVHLQYGFMATSEPQKKLINKKGDSFLKIDFIVA